MIVPLLVSAAFALPAQAAKHRTVYDKPVREITLKAKPSADQDEIICTYYRDIMIRESGTDTPGPDTALMLPVTTPCTATKPAAAIDLKTAGFYLLGRKGPFLVFDLSDPNGAVPFRVIAAASGRMVFEDASIGDLRRVELAGESLRLSYRRGINGDCSILQDGAACWRQFVQKAHLPPEIARQPAPAAACAADYARHHVPKDDPAIISYDVEMQIGLDGKAAMASQGGIGCAYMP